MANDSDSVLSGSRALVTGGGLGIGKHLVEALGEAGAEVVICGRKPDPLRRTAQELAEKSIRADWVQADITHEADVQRLASEVGPISILVNNAATSIRTPWERISLEEWREVMACNLEAPLRLCQLFVPAMVEAGYGRVVNIASVYGVVAGNPAYYHDLGLDICSYFTSKHGLIGLTKFLAVSVARQGVTVNALSPGMFPASEGITVNHEVSENLARATPMGRTGRYEDLKQAITYLCSPGASFVTGQNLIVDGGWTIW